MNELKNVKFLPWVGERYANGVNGLKTLILGESQYIKKSHHNPEEFDNKKNWTQDIIRDRIALKPSTSLQTFLNNNRMILGIKDKTKLSDLWNDLAFYNFIQITIGSGNHKDKSRLTAEVIKISRKALIEVVNDLKPELVIVWGKGKINKWLPQNKKYINKNMWKLDDIEAVFWNIKHPSKFFKWTEYHKEYKEVVEYIKQNITPQ